MELGYNIDNYYMLPFFPQFTTPSDRYLLEVLLLNNFSVNNVDLLLAPILLETPILAIASNPVSSASPNNLTLTPLILDPLSMITATNPVSLSPVNNISLLVLTTSATATLV